ncbi:putative amine oxidase [copper-containing] [Liolophura sinensis]|uniref:putative amine oxidase [copper-containing] n=1 Tax=Liolophura sinensis TaxID=3198878 RepID=UPI0031593BE4
MTYRYRTGEKDYSEYWRFMALLLLLISLSLGIALTVIAVLLAQELSVPRNVTDMSISTEPIVLSKCGLNLDDIDISESVNPTVFSDLTGPEFESINRYLFDQTDLNVTKITEARIDSSYVHLIELLLPNKAETLKHLDGKTDAPKRWAKVVLFRGDLSIPEVQEYKVGPLPTPTSHRLLNYTGRRINPIPFNVRPPTLVELLHLEKTIWVELFTKLGFIIYESFGILVTDCKDKCLSFSSAPVSTSNIGSIKRQIWVGFNFQTEYYKLHPIDLQVLLQLDGTDPSKFNMSTVWYNQQSFKSADDLIQMYSNDSISKLKTSFPSNQEKEFSTMTLRGDILEKESHRAPRQLEPDGKRYTVKHQKVGYLGWSFHYRMSTSTGPMLLDVQYRKNRIAYEISLQEIVVFYSASNPLNRFSDFVDSLVLLGYAAKALVPGGDCPQHATFLPARHQTSSEPTSIVYKNAFCLFEQSTGVPLRRHHSYTSSHGSFYSGMMDDVLILRTILTIGNYDYIFDFIFHQNGVLEVKGISTGYIITSVYSPAEEKYGFRLQERVLGNIHHHMFNFKIDIDVSGNENRFETLDINVYEADNTDWSTNPETSTYHQIMFNRTLKSTELEAAYTFNFDAPKYLIFHNENSTDKYGNPRAYRISLLGMSKQTLPIGRGAEPSISWSRYQMAVTKRHEHEQSSSSMYAVFDALDPVVNFQDFLDDNETIVDQDLVAWITMGVHHIPHTEDLPVTPTTGGHLSFFLSPYNYFPEDPSMASRSAVRIDLSGTSAESPVNISRYGLDTDIRCVPESTDAYDEAIREDKNLLFSDF